MNTNQQHIDFLMSRSGNGKRLLLVSVSYLFRRNYRIPIAKSYMLHLTKNFTNLLLMPEANVKRYECYIIQKWSILVMAASLRRTYQMPTKCIHFVHHIAHNKMLFKMLIYLHFRVVSARKFVFSWIKIVVQICHGRDVYSVVKNLQQQLWKCLWIIKYVASWFRRIYTLPIWQELIYGYKFWEF